MIMAKKVKAKGKTSASRKAAGTKVPMHKIVHFVRMLHSRKHAAKFIASAKKSKASVMIPQKAVKFVSDFVRDRGISDACPTTDPFKCDT
jgi:hypothetical protein